MTEKIACPYNKGYKKNRWGGTFPICRLTGKGCSARVSQETVERCSQQFAQDMGSRDLQGGWKPEES
jgi:hypothetical protein